ncbi:hypothetical protein N836_22855 [Leptolyngbya sp. Heron Island J]|uniref:hypothetical protein n=1 Tax=Leptolyngbya sp. Heron Island J TaxID=1385935 RepID=UPI0003B953C5|nr:hypothetical protein [Leptolyngbya sp. Heron Island J]ESA33235.1 hypothetical protein N836_22855 [Leptolyngbya sp. Heron Island J]
MKATYVGLVSLLLVLCSCTGSASAQGGGFSTLIVTPGRTGEMVNLDAQSLPLSLLFLVLGLIPFAFLREIYNLIRFNNKSFTDDPELIEFTRNINQDFKNVYSARYAKANEPWVNVAPSQELAATAYQDVIDKAELIDLTSQMFAQYQRDWTEKKFNAMANYIDRPLYDMQTRFFKDVFGKSFDIVYRPTLQAVVPLSCNQQEDSHLFKLQINAEIINFAVSSQGYVLSGEAYPRAFTEYWTIRINVDQQCSLVDIEQFHNLPKAIDYSVFLSSGY